MDLPPIPQPGRPVEASWGRRVVDYLRALTPQSSPTVAATMTSGGTTFNTRRKRGGGSQPTIRPLHLIVTTDPEDTSENPPKKIRVVASTIAGGSSTDVGFAEGDDPPYLLTPAIGVVQGGITVDSSGNVTSRWIEIVSSLSADTEDTFYVEIGTVGWDDEAETWLVSNSRYGPIGAQICRNWFTSPPRYGVTFL